MTVNEDGTCPRVFEVEKLPKLVKFSGLGKERTCPKCGDYGTFDCEYLILRCYKRPLQLKRRMPQHDDLEALRRSCHFCGYSYLESIASKKAK